MTPISSVFIDAINDPNATHKFYLVIATTRGKEAYVHRQKFTEEAAKKIRFRVEETGHIKSEYWVESTLYDIMLPEYWKIVDEVDDEFETAIEKQEIMTEQHMHFLIEKEKIRLRIWEESRMLRLERERVANIKKKPFLSAVLCYEMAWYTAVALSVLSSAMILY